MLKTWTQKGTVRDVDGTVWECMWQQLEGEPLPRTTPVRLRKPGAEEYTHMVEADYSPDRFKPELIDGAFKAVSRFQKY